MPFLRIPGEALSAASRSYGPGTQRFSGNVKLLGWNESKEHLAKQATEYFAHRSAKLLKRNGVLIL